MLERTTQSVLRDLVQVGYIILVERKVLLAVRHRRVGARRNTMVVMAGKLRLVLLLIARREAVAQRDQVVRDWLEAMRQREPQQPGMVVTQTTVLGPQAGQVPQVLLAVLVEAEPNGTVLMVWERVVVPMLIQLHHSTLARRGIMVEQELVVVAVA